MQRELNPTSSKSLKSEKSEKMLNSDLLSEIDENEINPYEGDIDGHNLYEVNDDIPGYVNRKYKFKEGLADLSDDISTAFIDFVNNGMFNSYLLLLNEYDDKTPIADNLKLLAEHLLRLMDSSKKYLIIIDKPGKNTRYQTLSKDRVVKLIKKYNEPANEGQHTGKGSDIDWLGTGEEYKNYDYYTVIELDKVKKNNGSYFAYSHTTIFDLKDLQIIHVDDDEKTHKKVNKEHCFINAVRKFYGDKIEKKVEDVLHQIKNLIGTGQFKTANLKDILPDWLTITIQKYEDNGTKGRLYTYEKLNTKKDKSLVTHNVKLFLIREHYMPQIKLIGNLAAVKDVSKFNEHSTVLASTLVLSLIKNNKLVPCKYNYKVGEKLEEVDLSNIDNEQQLYKYKKKNIKNYIYIFADYEAIVYKTKKHLPFMLGWCDENSIKIYKARSSKDLYDNNMITWMFDDLIEKYNMSNVLEEHETNKEIKVPEFKIYFHNLKYDFHLILMNRYVTITGELERGGAQYSGQITYKGIKFNFADSYKLIAEPLDKFKKTFGLKNTGKMAFNLYNIVDLNNYNKQSIPLEEFKIMLKEREGIDYDEKLFKDYVFNEEYYHIRHYEDYLVADCETLRDGLNVLRNNCLRITKVDPFQHLTISKLSNTYLAEEGCFRGCYEITGNLLEYVMEAVTGGRTCSQDNKKFMIEDDIEDFDAVSQYVSVMSIIRFPKGKAELIKNLDINSIINLYQQFVITCKVKINKKQQIPMISQKNDAGVRQWTNNVDGFIKIDINTYYDLIKYHHAEITEIKEGVGWLKSNGYNDTINGIMRKLFNERLQAKQEENEGLSTCYKLIGNSGYGYLLISDSEYNIKYVRGISKFQSFINNNYYRIKSATKLDENENEETNRYRIKVYKAVMGGYNLAHLGMTILSKSKSLMNEVLGLANDNEIPIYYTDTDSIHLLKKDVPKLGDLYKEEYKRDLIGENLLQFHTDFKSENIKGKVWSKKFIVLGKKCYLDILINDKGEIDYHIRFKGAHSKNILAYCKENIINPEIFFTKLLNEEVLLLDICKDKVRFEFNDKSVSTKKEFIKEFKFISEKESEKESEEEPDRSIKLPIKY